jgi:hypothetical protein
MNWRSPETWEDVFVAHALSGSNVSEPTPRSRYASESGTRAQLGPGWERELSRGVARSLSRTESAAAQSDQGLRRRVFAPAAQRVPKPPLPADERFYPPISATNWPEAQPRYQSAMDLQTAEDAGLHELVRLR